MSAAVSMSPGRLRARGFKCLVRAGGVARSGRGVFSLVKGGSGATAAAEAVDGNPAEDLILGRR